MVVFCQQWFLCVSAELKSLFMLQAMTVIGIEVGTEAGTEIGTELLTEVTGMTGVASNMMLVAQATGPQAAGTSRTCSCPKHQLQQPATGHAAGEAVPFARCLAHLFRAA